MEACVQATFNWSSDKVQHGKIILFLFFCFLKTNNKGKYKSRDANTNDKIMDLGKCCSSVVSLQTLDPNESYKFYNDYEFQFLYGRK